MTKDVKAFPPLGWMDNVDNVDSPLFLLIRLVEAVEQIAATLERQEDKNTNIWRDT